MENEDLSLDRVIANMRIAAEMSDKASKNIERMLHSMKCENVPQPNNLEDKVGTSLEQPFFNYTTWN